MSADTPELTKDDLSLLSGDEPAAENTPQQQAEPAPQEGDKPVSEAKADPAESGEKPAAEAPKTVLDDADDEPTKDAGDKPKEDKPKEELKPADASWREEFADSILARLKDKIPEDKIAARRTAILNQLGRYKTQLDYMTAGFAAQERIRSGEMKSKLADDATDEEKAEWRKENGLPEKASEYDIPKIAGHKWTEADEPLIRDFKKAAFGSDMTQDQVNKAVEWYVATTQKQAQDYFERTAQVDSEDGEKMRAQMRAELGVDYKPTAALLRRGLEDRGILSEEAANGLVGGRYTDKDGVSRRIINNPDVLNLLTNYFRDTYGDASFIRGDARPNSANVIEEGEKIMQTDLDRYYREGWDQKVLAAREEEEKLASRRGRRAA